MAVLTGTEQGASAATQWSPQQRINSPDAPEQSWSSAEGRSFKAKPSTTDATASGGHDDPVKAPGELPAEFHSVGGDLGAAKKPVMGQATVVPAPASTGVEGFDRRHSKELAGERDERSRTFLNPDGTRTTQLYDEPVNFREANGRWRPIDTTLVRPEGAATMSLGGKWRARSTATPITFAEYGNNGPLVRMQTGEKQSIAYSVEGAAPALGRVEGSTVTYPGIRRATDLELIAGGASVKETLVLRNREAPTEWRFPLELDGLTARLIDGGVSFDDASGRQHAWMPPGWMEDSRRAENANEGVISSGVSYRLSGSAGQQVLTVMLDGKWLNAPERVFPVRVDPSVTGVSSTSGTYVQYPYDQNFSGDTILKVGTHNGGGTKAAGLLRFAGLETTLKNAWVLDAKLNLYNTWSYSCSARPVTIHPITSNWAESTTTTYPGPATGPSLASKSFAHGWRPEGTTTWSCGPAWEGMPLGSAGRSLVDDWTHARKKNYGLAVKASTSDSRAWKQFGSDDYPNGKPRLDVTWTKYGATYKVGGFVTPVTATAEGSMKVTVTNQGQQAWAAGSNFKLRYNLFDSAGKAITDTAKIRWTPMPSEISPGESVTLTAKIAPLTPATYTLQWTMDEYGVRKFTDEGVPGVAVKFSAVNVPPQLTSESPASGAVLNSLTPSLWAEGRDTDHYPGSPLQYTFEVCEVSGKDSRKNCRSGTRSTARQWAVPSGWLSWGKNYAWYTYVWDGQAASARPYPAFFTTQVPQPAVTGRLGSEGGREFASRTGNYATAASDASIPTVGPELSVKRTYNSLDPRRDTAFGTGWSTRWDMQLHEEEGTNSVLIVLADGSRVRFGVNPDGTYAGPSGGTMTLSRVGEGEFSGWVLRERSGTAYHFSYDSLLRSITDSAGRRQSLEYADHDGGGPLTSVTDGLSGRSLTFVWSGGHITAVTTSAVSPSVPGLTWTYTYSGDQLTKVCPPSSATACTTYAYEDGSVYRSMVLDQNPVSYWRLGETQGPTGISQAPSRNGLEEIFHRDVQLGQPGAIAGTSDTAASFDGVDSSTVLPEAALQASTFLSLELWFKTTKPGVLVGFQGGELEDGIPHYWSPLAIDTAGKLRGQFEITGKSNTPIVSPTAVTDGRWHHVVMAGAGTTQTMYLDGAAVGSLTGPIDHHEKINAYLGAGYSSPAWDATANGVRRLTGQLDEVALYHHALDSTTVAEHYAARAQTPRMTMVTLPSGRVHAKVTYDSGTGRVIETTDQNGGTWKISDPSYSSASSSYADSVIGSGPLGYWRLGERTGAAALSSVGDGMDGSYLDGVHLGSPGTFADGDDTSVTFDGTAESAVKVPAEALGTTTSPSIELWFKTTKPGVLVSQQNTELGTQPTDYRPMLNVDTAGKLRGQFVGGEVIMTSTATVTDDKWHHAVLTSGKGAQALYLDGVQVGISQLDPDLKRMPHMYIGSGWSAPGWDGGAAGQRNFDGQIDEVAFYDKSLVTFVVSGTSDLVFAAPDHFRSGHTVGRHYRARSNLVQGNADQYRDSVMSDAPASYWRFDEETGTKLSSGVAVNAGDATFQDTAGANETSGRVGWSGAFGTSGGNAVRFAGKTSVQIPGTLLGGAPDLTVEMWFRTGTPTGVLLGAQNTALGTTPTAWRPILNIDQTGKLRGEFSLSGMTGATPITSAQVVTDDEWHHVVLSATGSTQTLYLDGVQVGSLSGARADQRTAYAYLGAGYASPDWIGAANGTRYFAGTIDEPAIYQHALTEQEVSAHYRAKAESANVALGATVKVTNPVGDTTSTTYDAVRGDRVTSETDPQGGVTTYGYDSGGFLHTVTDPNGHTVTSGHDARGNTVSRTTCRDTNSCWTSFTEYYLNAADRMDPRNDKPVAARDARSANPVDNRYRTTMSYTATGLPTTTTLADGRTQSRTYTAGTEAAVGGGTAPAGLVETEKTPAGATTSYAYFSNGDLAQVTSPGGLVTRFTYDGLGRKLSETQVSDSFPGGVTTTYAYDNMSRVVTETGAAVKNEITGVTHTAKISRAFDPDGLLLSESTEDTTGADPKRTTTHTYDAHGLNEYTWDSEGNRTRYSHDGLGRVDVSIDQADNLFSYRYTPNGQHHETALFGWKGDPSGESSVLVLQSNAYDPAGRLASTTDAMGATTAFTYFNDGLLATTTAKQVTQSDGTKRDIVLESSTYNGAGHLTQQVTGGGRTTVAHTVDATGRTTSSVLDPNGLNRVTTYGYDGDDRLTTQARTIDPSGKKLTTTTEYDTAGNPVRSTLTDGTSTRATTQSFDDRGLLISTVSPRGNVTGADAAAYTTTRRYDALGKLVEQQAPAVETEEKGEAAQTVRPAVLTGYNTFGEVTETKDARGAVTRTQVDKLGRPVAVTLPDYTPPGGTKVTAVSRTEYDSAGRIAATTDPLGRTTRYGYDQLGHLTTKTDPVVGDGTLPTLAENEFSTLNSAETNLAGAGLTRYTWTPTGRQLSVTNPTGARNEATYDELGRKLTETTVERYPSPQNLTTRYSWDDASNQIASTTPGSRTTTGTYNPAGEIVAMTDPLGGVTKFGYDGLGRQTETVDATNRRTTTLHDPLGNITGTTDFGTGTTALRSTSVEYDADGNRTAFTSPTQARTTYTYDALGRMTRQTEPVSAARSLTTTFGYDAAGNRTRLTDGRGNSTIYTFTPWNLPESTIEPATAAHPEAGDRTWSTVYDAAGQSVVDLLPGGVKRERTYDALGRLIAETGTGAEAPTIARRFEYDLASRLTAAGTDDSTGLNTYAYNDRGQLLSAAGPAGTSSYTYDVDGNMTLRDTTGGSTSYGYDAAGRADWTWDSITGSNILYDFDAAGRPTVERYATKPEGSTEYTESARRTFGYDTLGRLRSDRITDPSGSAETASTTYDYDLGDRVTKKATTGTAGAAESSYGYDQAGRLTSWVEGGTSTTYEWDDASNRTKVGSTSSTYDSRNRLQSDGTSTYGYTPRGTMSSVTSNGTTRALTFDAFERKITDGSSVFTYDSLDRVAKSGEDALTYDGGSNGLTSDGPNKYSRGPSGSLQAMANGTTKQWAVTDRHTDVVAGLSPDGRTVTASTTYTPFGEVTATAGAGSSLGYQSGWTDPSSGDVNMAARWYRPGTGAFVSRDTWQLDPSPSAQANRMLFGNADPLNHTDPSGHCAGWWILVCEVISIIGEDILGPHTDRAGARDCGGIFLDRCGTRNTWDALLAQSKNVAAQPQWSGGNNHDTPLGYGSSGGQSGGRGGNDYSCNGQCGTTSIRPPKPPIDQNPNNGRNPFPAPTLPPAAAVWTAATWATGTAVSATFTSQAMLDLLAIAMFAPDVISGLDPRLQPQPGGGTRGRTRTDKKCDDGPGASKNGHQIYLPRERYYDSHSKQEECRATGVYGLLDQSDLTTKKHPGPGTSTNSSPRPPGYDEINSKPGQRAHNGHLIPKLGGGSGTDLRNLVAQYSHVNTPYLRDTIEKDIRGGLESGQRVTLSIVPHYDNESSGVPTRIEYNYSVVGSGEWKHCTVFNQASGGKTVGTPNCPRK
ncbi:LamG-like jellyroll fold domain-containing protein [Streptomyces sp. NPDC015346]|uniref:LamG-like jellyroll fold domain-containing protein n=1 Tax=Streptomyces sp. NPDC015346 TaxID=3364954 RepID=UPI0036F78AFD